MFNIFDVQSIRSNPILAKSFIRLVPAYELTKIILDDNKNAAILDELVIINGILESNNPDLQLVLAAYSTLGGWTDCVDNILKLYEKGEDYRAAVFGNSRIDWYYGNSIFIDTASSSLKEVGISIVAKEICENGSHLVTICRNPRMDRRLLATAIRGLEQFSKLSIEKRVEIAYLAMDVEELESEQYVGKDKPDQNEIHFDKPIKALLPFLKEIFERNDGDVFQKIVMNWLWKIANIQFEIDAQDWNEVEIIIDSLEPKRKTSNDIFEANRAKWHTAFSHVVMFLSDTTKSLPDEFPKTQRDYALAVLPSIVLSSLLKSYWNRPKIREHLDELLKHPNWTIRAAYYSSVFGVTQITKSGDAIYEFFKKYELDVAEKWVGLTSTKLFQLSKRSINCERAINDAVIHSQYQVELEHIDSEVLKFLYVINPHNYEYEKLFAIYNQDLQINPSTMQLVEILKEQNIARRVGQQRDIDATLTTSRGNEEEYRASAVVRQRDVDATLASLDEHERGKSSNGTFLQRLFKKS
jgi:hypothetical protein